MVPNYLTEVEAKFVFGRLGLGPCIDMLNVKLVIIGASGVGKVCIFAYFMICELLILLHFPRNEPRKTSLRTKVLQILRRLKLKPDSNL
jgi:hypothetical protein